MSTRRLAMMRATPARRFYVAHVEIREGDPRGLSDGFSVTGELYEPHGTWSGEAQHRNGRDPDMFGAISDELRTVFPELIPLIDLHLSDLDGTPMHALANGWYWYEGIRKYGDQPNHETAARLLRVSALELPRDLDREGFAAFVEAQRDRWAREADAAREVFESLAQTWEVES